MKDEEFVLVRLDVLPEAIQKTLMVKHMLESELSLTVQEAVERVGLSRSSFYKYKDAVYPFSKMSKEKIVNIVLVLEHRAGILSSVLSFMANCGANILTINQTIPLQGEASVSLSVETIQLNREIDEMMNGLRLLEGVRRAVVVGSGE